ncbi:hypothetical protein SFRURICE_014143 [Spodoptera frugiperda]|nr:hypothetical protein SFRURICE_014143 [Spodoptera frugiperda]
MSCRNKAMDLVKCCNMSQCALYITRTAATSTPPARPSRATNMRTSVIILVLAVSALAAAAPSVRYSRVVYSAPRYSAALVRAPAVLSVSRIVAVPRVVTVSRVVSAPLVARYVLPAPARLALAW